MTLTTLINKNEYDGNGVTTSFAYQFLVLDSTHMHVYFDGVKQTEGYVVNNVGTPAGGNVDFSVAPGSGVRVSLLRVVPLNQVIDYIEYGPFEADTHEAGMDKLTMIAQQLEEQVSRAISAPIGGDPDVDFSLPLYEAGKGIVWDEVEKKLVNSNDIINELLVDCQAQLALCQAEYTKCQGEYTKCTLEVAAAAAQAGFASTSAINAASSESNASASQAAAGSHELTAAEWATLLGTKIDGNEWSAKEYAIGTAVPAGSAKYHAEQAPILAQAVVDTADVKKDQVNEFLKAQNYATTWVGNYSGTYTIDARNNPKISINANGNLTLAAPTSFENDQHFEIRITQNDNYTLSFSGTWEWHERMVPDLPSNNGSRLIIQGCYFGSSLYAWVSYRKDA